MRDRWWVAQRPHRTLLAMALAAWLARTAVEPAHAACACGPDFCQDDGRVAGALAAKRRALAKAGYPERLLRLFDRAPRCVAAAERAPDGFTLLRVAANGDKDARAWSQAAEDAARADLLAGTLRSYHVMNVRHALSCCQEPCYADRPDYDRDLDLNTDAAISCWKSGTAASCK